MKKARPMPAGVRADTKAISPKPGWRRLTLFAGCSWLSVILGVVGVLLIAHDVPYARSRLGGMTFPWFIVAVMSIQAFFLTVRAYRSWKDRLGPAKMSSRTGVWPPPPIDPHTGKPIPPPS